MLPFVHLIADKFSIVAVFLEKPASPSLRKRSAIRHIYNLYRPLSEQSELNSLCLSVFFVVAVRFQVEKPEAWGTEVSKRIAGPRLAK